MFCRNTTRTNISHSPFNAGDLEFQLTREIRNLLTRLAVENRLDRFPLTLAFLSAVDATVSTRAVVMEFFMKLPPGGHELVVFDLNRREGMEPLFTSDPKDAIRILLNDKTLRFNFSVISNRDPDTTEVVMRVNKAQTPSILESPLRMEWPEGSYSLSHVALPFPPDDPLYGGPDAKKSPGIALGKVALRGEKGALKVPARDMLRQRWNPFYAVIETRTENFLSGED